MRMPWQQKNESQTHCVIILNGIALRNSKTGGGKSFMTDDHLCYDPTSNQRGIIFFSQPAYLATGNFLKIDYRDLPTHVKKAVVNWLLIDSKNNNTSLLN